MAIYSNYVPSVVSSVDVQSISRDVSDNLDDIRNSLEKIADSANEAIGNIELKPGPPGPEGPVGPPGSGNGTYSETRYAASTEDPGVRNIFEREPVTYGGDIWSTSIVGTSHPNKNYIWAITARILSEEAVSSPGWSDPVKYATPDSTESVSYFTLSPYDEVPPYSPSGVNPGPDWTATMPESTKDKGVWMTRRLQFTDGSPQTQWTYPILIEGKPGDAGQDGLSDDTWFTESMGRPLTPTGYPPSDIWTKSRPDDPESNVWATSTKIKSDGSWSGEDWLTPLRITGDQGLQGPEGPQGPAGERGEQGMQGPEGPAGVKGETGSEGPQGPQGPAGVKGEDGAQGPEGPQGPAGVKGEDGVQGPQGPEGPIGPKGSDGTSMKLQGRDTLENILSKSAEIGDMWMSTTSGSLPDGTPVSIDDVLVYVGEGLWNNVGSITGPQGPEGPQGPAGVKGDKGETGSEGPEGPQGPAGVKGDNGAQGPEGPQGPAGIKGSTGERGPEGPQGPAGLKGETGIQGPIGPQGKQGPKGDTGSTGDQGPQGLQGPAGQTGAAGKDGKDGKDGSNGPIAKTPKTQVVGTPQMFPVDYIKNWERFDIARAEAWIKQHANRLPLEHDVVFQADFEEFNSKWITAQVVKHYNPQTSSWELWWYSGYNTFFGDLVVDGTIRGNKLVAGSITGDKIQANTEISSPKISGGTIGIGAKNPTTGEPAFWVDNQGNLSSSSAFIKGEISGSNINGGQINIGNGNFRVDVDGNLYAESGTFNGSISAENMVGAFNQMYGFDYDYTGNIPPSQYYKSMIKSKVRTQEVPMGYRIGGIPLLVLNGTGNIRYIFKIFSSNWSSETELGSTYWDVDIKDFDGILYSDFRSIKATPMFGTIFLEVLVKVSPGFVGEVKTPVGGDDITTVECFPMVNKIYRGG